MRKLVARILRWCGLGPQTYTFVLPNKNEIALEGMQCLQCQNAFWIEHGAIEMPSYCCYCGSKFEKITEVDAETFQSSRDSSN